jgi:hypothetical protein
MVRTEYRQHFICLLITQIVSVNVCECLGFVGDIYFVHLFYSLRTLNEILISKSIEERFDLSFNTKFMKLSQFML